MWIFNRLNTLKLFKEHIAIISHYDGNNHNINNIILGKDTNSSLLIIPKKIPTSFHGGLIGFITVLSRQCTNVVKCINRHFDDPINVFCQH